MIEWCILIKKLSTNILTIILVSPATTAQGRYVNLFWPEEIKFIKWFLLQSTKPNEFSPFVTSFACEYAIIKISSVRYKSWQALPLYTCLFFEVVSPSGVNFLCFSPSWPPLQCVKRVTIVVVLPAKTIAKIKISTNAILDCSLIWAWNKITIKGI